MKRRLILALAALAGVGCGDIQTERTQPKQVEPDTRKFVVGEDLPFPSLAANDIKGRSFTICEFTHRIVERQLHVSYAETTSPDCISDFSSQIQDAGHGRYTISSWVEIGGVRTEYSGDAVIEAKGGIRIVRITRLDLKGGAQ